MNRVSEKVGLWLAKDSHTKQELAGQLDISLPTLQKRIEDSDKWTLENVYKLSELMDEPVSAFIGD